MSTDTASKKSTPAQREHPRPVGESGARMMTEDQADILYCEKHKREKGIPLKQVLEDLGISEDEVGL